MLAVAVIVATPDAFVLAVRLEREALAPVARPTETDGRVGDRVAVRVCDPDLQRLRERRADRGGLGATLGS